MKIKRFLGRDVILCNGQVENRLNGLHIVEVMTDDEGGEPRSVGIRKFEQEEAGVEYIDGSIRIILKVYGSDDVEIQGIRGAAGLK